MLVMTALKVKLSTDLVLKGLEELRNQTILCDVHLVAEGAKFPAHRVVLAAASPYFQAMFTGGFKENQMSEITLNDTSAKGLQCVLDAIYTGELSLSEENVCDVLPVASLLQLNEIVEHCGRFLTENVSALTCLSFLSAAEKYDLQEAVDECNNFVLENFNAISQSNEFTNLSKEQLVSYISDNQLKVGNGEMGVFRATLKWFEANRSVKGAEDNSSDLADLMQHVRFPLIPGDLLLNEILTCLFISKNPEVTRMVTEALQFQSNDKVFLQPLQEGKQFQPRGEQMLVLIESKRTRTDSSKQSFSVLNTKLHIINITGEDPFQTHFSERTLPMRLYFCNISLVAKGNYLFIFGADAEYLSPIAMRFDVRTNTWLDLKPPPYKVSVGKAATLLKSNIYLLGGIKHAIGEFTVKSSDVSACGSQYSIETNSWSDLEDMPKPLAFHSAASHGNDVFCAGGCSANSGSDATVPTDKLYAYDVVGKIWLSKASMHCKRVQFSMEAVGAKLVACGGKREPSIEIYDIADDQWTLIQNGVLEHHLFPATVALNDKVYVIGGYATQEDGPRSATDYVSVVDAENATLQRVSSLPFPVRHHSCALLTVPNTGLPEPQSQ